MDHLDERGRGKAPGRAARCRAGAARWSAAAVLSALLAAPAGGPARAAALQAVEDFGPNPGQLDMYVYAPDVIEAGASLVVALHGCAQGAADFDDETGLIALADAFGFVLVLPEQRRTNNEARCFNWFRRADNRRDQGEAASLRQMIQHARDTFETDASQIFVLGLSAGGSMAAVLMASYPEVFAGGAVIAGTPYDCNTPTSIWDWQWWWFDTWVGDAAAASFGCGLLGQSPSERAAKDWGDYVRAASPGAPARWPRVSLWQGDADEVVDPINLGELVKQWTDVHGIDQAPDDGEDDGEDDGAVSHRIYRDAGGAALVETYEIAGFAHALPVDPGAGPQQCGKIADYVADADICSTLKILEFWGVAP
jgi:poly(3-hydroxybutyrate) depolymerase